MIHLTRLNGASLILNPDLFEHIHADPDTVITLTSGRNYPVLESPEEVIRRIVAYRRHLLAGIPTVSAPGSKPEVSHV